MSGEEILLVEGRADDVLLAVRALRKNGVDGAVTVVRDGVEALRYLLGRAGGGLPRLVLLDAHLPKVDGSEVLERIRAEERTRRLPVVVLASSEGEHAAMADRGPLADLCIEKSVDFETFVREIGRVKLLLESAQASTDERVAGEMREGNANVSEPS